MPPRPTSPVENNLGIAAETPNDPLLSPPFGFLDPEFPYILRRLLMRTTVCPGDYNRDGVVNPADALLFNFHGANQLDPCTPGDPYFPFWCQYVDWNFDGGYDLTDLNKFNAGYNNWVCPP